MDEARLLTAQANDQNASMATLTDSFNPWELHVYKFPNGDPNALHPVSCDGPSATTLAALPEPGTFAVLAAGCTMFLRRRTRRTDIHQSIDRR